MLSEGRADEWGKGKESVKSESRVDGQMEFFQARESGVGTYKRTR